MKQKFIYLYVLIGLSTCCFATQGMDDTATVNKLLFQASSFQRTHVDSCFLLTQQAFVLADKSDYQAGKARASSQLCAVMMIRGNNDSALIYATQAVNIGKAIQKDELTAFALLLMGYIYQDKGDSEKALSYFYEAMYYGKKAGDAKIIVKIGTGLGDFYFNYNEYAKALVYYTNGYRVAQKNGYLSDEADALLGIGNVHYMQKQYHEALNYYKQVDTLSRRVGEITGVAQNLNNIGLCYADLKQKANALYYYHSALAVYIEHHMPFEESNLYYNLACMYVDFKQNDSAIYYLNKSVLVATQVGDERKIAKCYSLLGKAYAQTGNYRQAYTYNRLFTELSDSLLNSEKIASISEMETKYLTREKQQQIELLSQQDAIKNSQRNVLVWGLMGMIVFVMEVMRQRNKAKVEKLRSDQLLLNILPHEVAEELKQHGAARARQYTNVTVLFTDFVNFTGISQQMDPTELVAEIHSCFTAFDLIIEKHGLEKIKTIGDAYLAVSGLPNESADHAQRAVLAAKEIREHMSQEGIKFDVRIGISSGPVVAGIVGVKKYAYDIWGDTVNTAARMEQHSESGKINISGLTYQLVQHDFSCTYRGKIQAKNKGEVDMYFVQ